MAGRHTQARLGSTSHQKWDTHYYAHTFLVYLYMVHHTISVSDIRALDEALWLFLT